MIAHLVTETEEGTAKQDQREEDRENCAGAQRQFAVVMVLLIVIIITERVHGIRPDGGVSNA